MMSNFCKGAGGGGGVGWFFGDSAALTGTPRVSLGPQTAALSG